MLKTRKTIFISDLHLEESSPKTCNYFLEFLQGCDASIDALYILGDLFETWIGDDCKTPFYQKIITALNQTTQKGLPIYFLCGNRDFLIGKKFLSATGCKLLSEEEKIFLYGTPILLMHGDTLCTKDVAYLRVRKILRNRFLLSLFLLLIPLKARQTFANTLRAKSKRYTQSTSQHIMDVTQDAVVQVMQKHTVSYLIHGHTHRPAIHEFTLSQHPAMRIVLGAWHECGHALIWHDSGKKELISFKD